MAIVNRDLDYTEQRHVVSVALANTSTGVTYPVMVVPFPSKIVACYEGALGLSGSPVHSLWLQRFVVGAGLTSIVLGSTIPVAAIGTSGTALQGFTVLASGVTYPLQAGDTIALYTQGANAGTVETTVTVVIQALQDIRTAFGV